MSAAGSEVRWDELARGAADAAAGQDGEARAREQLLTFTLDGAPYAIPVDRVREIVRLRPITSVPRVPSDVLGVISLRGEIVQVIDLRRRLGLRAGSPLARARIVIVREDEGGAAGLLVDGVDDVFALEPDLRRPRPSRCRRCVCAATRSYRWSTSRRCGISMQATRAEAYSRNHVSLACFEARGGVYAIDVTQLREVVRWHEPALIPVVDLGRALGGAPLAPGPHSRICVTEVEDLVMGLAVDAALHVVPADAGHLEDPPALTTQSGYGTARAVVRRPGADPMIVLSLENLLERVYRSALDSEEEAG